MNRRLEELEAAAAAAAAEESEEVEGDGQEDAKQASKVQETEHESHNVYNASDTEDTNSINTLPPLRLTGSHSENELENEEDGAKGTLENEPFSDVFHETHNSAQAIDVAGNNANNEKEEEEVGGEEGVPAGVDGDDEKTTPETFQNLLAAFSAKTAPLLGLHVTKDLCRRLTSIYDKGLASGSYSVIFPFEKIRSYSCLVCKIKS